MAVNNLLDTSTVSMSDILGNGKTYAVPPYQRDYSWKRDHWEDLWSDIISIAETDSKVHYMGSVVLQDMNDKKYHVIDGQQRFSTLTLIVLATIRQLQTLVDREIEIEENLERIQLLQKKFIGDKDPGSLTYSSKLKLNENNDSFFQSNLLVFRAPLNVKTLQDSDRLLWQAYSFFVERLSLYFDSENSGEKIANFLNKLIAERLMFIQIVVEDELSAYTVFETLNSRGVGLTVTDLLKNYLFSISSTVDLPYVKQKWKNIVDIIGLDTFPTFLRHYWISKNKLIRQDHLFRVIRESIQNSTEVIDLLDSLVENALLYNALSNYSDSFWNGDRELKYHVKELVLFKEKQAYPILIATYNNLDIETFKKVLRFVTVITFRYTVIARLHTNTKEDVYNKAALKISAGEATSASQIAELIKPLYPSDGDFINDLASKSISTKSKKKLVRYILFNIENHVSSSQYDFEEHPATIEHILPENGNDLYLDQFPSAIHESFVYRIGNYCLLEENKNRDCDNKSFTEKQEIYKTSTFLSTTQIGYSTWTPSSIDNRQSYLAHKAAAIWRISQYS